MSAVIVHRETDVVAFALRVLPVLLEREIQHNVMLGLFSVLQARRPEVPPWLAWAERGGEMAGVALQTDGHNLLLAHGLDHEVIEALARDRYSDQPALPGVLSSAETAATFAAIWQQLSGQTGQLGRSERLYRLTEVRPVPAVAGHLRPALDSDIELVADWWLAFSAEAVEPVTRERALQAIANRYGVDPLVGGLRLWEVEGVPVSLAGYTGPTPNSIRIGPVYTPPEQRGRGYATAAVAQLSRELLDKGFACVTLFTDLANPTSNHIYQTIGFEPAADMDEIHFEPVG